MIQRARRGLPTIGFAKIGQPTPKDSPKKGAPEKFDHLEFTGLTRDKHGRLEPDLAILKAVLAQGGPTCGGCDRAKILADHFKAPMLAKGLPTQAKVFFPYDNLQLTMPNDLFYFRGSSVYCKGDMVNAMRREVLSEKTRVLAHIGEDRKRRREAIQDFVWALLNTKEFLFNH